MHLPNIVIMGVAGSGKTTVGQLLARSVNASFIEGDALHPPRNVERMAAGIPLTDEDRREWLEALRARIELGCAQGERMVVACSALKRAYRDRLRLGDQHLYWVALTGDPALLAERLAARQGHYMPPSLLDSQLADFEPPEPDEQAFTCDIGASPEDICERIRQHLQTGLSLTSF